MLDYQVIAEEYAKSYVDKSRIYFIEKYLSTFNANVGKNLNSYCFHVRKHFFIV